MHFELFFIQPGICALSKQQRCVFSLTLILCVWLLPFLNTIYSGMDTLIFRALAVRTAASRRRCVASHDNVAYKQFDLPGCALLARHACLSKRHARDISSKPRRLTEFALHIEDDATTMCARADATHTTYMLTCSHTRCALSLCQLRSIRNNQRYTATACAIE